MKSCVDNVSYLEQGIPKLVKYVTNEQFQEHVRTGKSPQPCFTATSPGRSANNLKTQGYNLLNPGRTGFKGKAIFPH